MTSEREKKRIYEKVLCRQKLFLSPFFSPRQKEERKKERKKERSKKERKKERTKKKDEVMRYHDKAVTTCSEND